MMRTSFDETSDYDHARGIAEALRGHICTAWQLMHRARREAAEPGPWSPCEIDFRHRMAVRWEQQLAFLLRIRREGMH